MDNFKEFQGKDLDDCIRQACEYYNADREKLEIEIIQDAKSGIFGIVGARKAKIRAKRARLAGNIPPFKGAASQTLSGTVDKGVREAREKTRKKNQSGREDATGPKQNATRHNSNDAHPTLASDRSGESEQTLSQECLYINDQDQLDEMELVEGCFSPKSFDELDIKQLEELTREVIRTLVTPVAGKEIVFSVSFERGQIQVNIDWHGDAGLLIGREGQTLSAIQYLASRIISRSMNSALRVNLDIGEYRRKQEEKLCYLAKSLAEKARQTGKSFSTRPLSSYHRRLVHLCLQNDPDILTRSAGDGVLKRVLVYPKRLNGRP